MDFAPGIAAAGFVVGVLVGLTGIGGGALTTPLLILVFDVKSFTAVSSDLVASLAMKIVGGGVHLSRGTVQTDLVRWLSIGSVPGAFAGVVILQALDASDVEGVITRALGAVLLIAAALLFLKPVIERRLPPRPAPEGQIRARRLPTVIVGGVVGLLVGITSVGSGSLVVVSLLFLYPGLRSSQLVGTDLVQAALLVASAALGHLIFGQVEIGLAGSLVAGSVPGVYLGARVSSRAPDRFLRPLLGVVLALTGIRLLA